MEIKEGKGKDEEKAKMKWETKKMLVEKKCRKKWGEGIMLMKFFHRFFSSLSSLAWSSSFPERKYFSKCLSYCWQLKKPES